MINERKASSRSVPQSTTSLSALERKGEDVRQLSQSMTLATFAWYTIILTSLLAMSGGIMLSIVGALSANLNEIMDNILWPTACQYGIAGICSTVYALLSPCDKSRRDGWKDASKFVKAGKGNFVIMLVGVVGVAQTGLNAVVAQNIGTGFYTLTALLGNVLSSLFFDRFGWLWTTKRPVSFCCILGFVIILAGSFLYRVPVFKEGGLQAQGNPHASVPLKATMLVLGAIAGLLCTVQGALGVQLGRELGAFRRAASYSYISGTTFMVVLAGIVDHKPGHLPARDSWRLCGGLLLPAVLMVIGVCPRIISVAALWVYFSFGQLVTALVIDANAWFGIARDPLDTYKIVGLCVVIFGLFCHSFGDDILRSLRKYCANDSAKDYNGAVNDTP